MYTRARLDLKPSDPGILPPEERQELTLGFGQLVDEGIDHLRTAILLDPMYDDAMSYLNLLIRERAELRNTDEEYQRDIREADEWVQRAVNTKRARASLAPLPPLPPPSQVTSASITPQRIRVDGKVQAANLIRKMDPVCPALASQARISGKVTLTLTIARDGSMQNIQVVNGHPLLVPAAIEAVKQWAYKPTLVNGDPVEVITLLDLPMDCR